MLEKCFTLLLTYLILVSDNSITGSELGISALDIGEMLVFLEGRYKTNSHRPVWFTFGNDSFVISMFKETFLQLCTAAAI